jgi:methylenetetrahydrofolate--tRNA-(uracil-5-)-methyltransferase
MTGVEGYVESAAIGLLAGRMAAAEMNGVFQSAPPPTTAHGALINHITGGHIETTDAGSGSFQPMNVNFGLFPPVDVPRGPDGKRLRGKAMQAARKAAYTDRAKADFTAWLAGRAAIAAE